MSTGRAEDVDAESLYLGSGVNDVSACDITSAALMHPLCGKLLEAFLAGCCSIMQMGGLLRLRFASCSELVGWGD